MKKKRFYDNKDRNQKWTEPEKGRKIYFADKYIEDGGGTNKFSLKEKKAKKPFFTKERRGNFAKRLIVLVCAVALVFTGYTLMDLHIIRNSMPVYQDEEESQGGVASVNVEIKGNRVESLALDGGIMLNSVIKETLDGGYTSVAFDVKRSDGTVGYESSLATVDMYGAEASQASDAPSSIKRLTDNDIMPVGVISCYKDSLYAQADANAAVKTEDGLYQDKDGNNYLNPDSQEAYSYIKSLAEEVSEMGVKVFILTDCDLPDEISENYSDGFDALNEKLLNDLGSDIKFVKGENITLSSDTIKELEEELTKKTENIDKQNTVLCVTAKDREKAKNVLDSTDRINYVIIG